MHRPCLIATCILLLCPATSMASADEAATIRKEWSKANLEWSEQAAKAVSAEDRIKLVASRPDAAAYANRMWQCISPELNNDWTLDPASWFLMISRGLRSPNNTSPLFAKQTEDLKKAILTHHIQSPKLATMCMALAQLGDPLSLSILEKIERNNPDPKVQGVAALAASMLIKSLGDDGELMRKRLTYLRKAIINSADVSIGNTTVAKLAENELYQIRFLSKGRVAPDISGTDSAGRPVQLSDHQGRVVVLIFWSSTIPQADHVIEFTNEMARKLKDKPVVILGINHDPLEKLRAMRADNTVSWRNISDPKNHLAREYRVGIWPMVYVLDAKRRIHHAGPLGSFAELTAESLADELR